MLVIAGVLLVTWGLTALFITRDVREERRIELNRLNEEYRILCATDPTL